MAGRSPSRPNSRTRSSSRSRSRVRSDAPSVGTLNFDEMEISSSPPRPSTSRGRTPRTRPYPAPGRGRGARGRRSARANAPTRRSPPVERRIRRNRPPNIPENIQITLTTVGYFIQELDQDVARHGPPYAQEKQDCQEVQELLGSALHRLQNLRARTGSRRITPAHLTPVVTLQEQFQRLAVTPGCRFLEAWNQVRPTFPEKLFGIDIARRMRNDNEPQPTDSSSEDDTDRSDGEDPNMLTDSGAEFSEDENLTPEEMDTEEPPPPPPEVRRTPPGTPPVPLRDVEPMEEGTAAEIPQRTSRPCSAPPPVGETSGGEPVPLLIHRSRSQSIASAPGRFRPLLQPTCLSDKVPVHFLQGPFPTHIKLRGETLLRYFQKNLQPLFPQKFSGKASHDSLTFQGFMRLFWNHVGQLDVPPLDKFTVLYQLLEGSAYNLISYLVLSLPQNAYQQALEILYSNYGDSLVAKQRLDEILDVLKPETNSKVAKRNFVLQLIGMNSRYQELGHPPSSFVPRLIERIMRYVGGDAVAVYFEEMARQGRSKTNFYVGCEEEAFQDFAKFVSEHLWARAELQDTLDLEVDPVPGCPSSARSVGSLSAVAGSIDRSPSSSGANNFIGNTSNAPPALLPVNSSAAPNPPAPPAPSTAGGPPSANTNAGNNGGSQNNRTSNSRGGGSNNGGNSNPAGNSNSGGNSGGNPSTGGNTGGNGPRRCGFCKSPDHPPVRCPLTTRERRKVLLDQRRCFNCMQSGHNGEKCNLPLKCLICLKDEDPKALIYKHITYICVKRDKKPSFNSPSSPAGQGGQAKGLKRSLIDEVDSLTAEVKRLKSEKLSQEQTEEKAGSGQGTTAAGPSSNLSSGEGSQAPNQSA